MEERQNHAFLRTLREHGSDPSRHFYEQFAALQHVTWETRTGAQLLEWVTREVALIDVAIAVAGLNDELCQWIANITRERLTRAYLAWEPETLTDERADYLQLSKFDLILSSDQPAAALPWTPVSPSIAAADEAAGLAPIAPPSGSLSDPRISAESFERIFVTRSIA